MKLHGLLAGTALLLAACASEPEPTVVTVSDVTVNADLTAVGSQEAAAFWSNLDTDLETAIASEFVGQTAPDGWLLVVDIDEIALASVFDPQLGADDARLTGQVALVNPASQRTQQTYIVSATANQAATFLSGDADVITISPSSSAFYGAVVQAFARGVRDTVLTGG